MRTEFNRLVAVKCTGCKYCLPGPAGVDIPRNFDLYNDGSRYGNLSNPAFFYWNWLKPSDRAENCSECGVCEKKCPQRITIRAELKKVKEAFARK
ncbi:MAG: 4Fe-4S dicluster domain-containing protein [Candidatus Edwardsbacteria bacterium]|nr:4Fe-4S dicluster domain-containing protein [Candidatus Edwardsbacteria bacterium]